MFYISQQFYPSDGSFACCPDVLVNSLGSLRVRRSLCVWNFGLSTWSHAVILLLSFVLFVVASTQQPAMERTKCPCVVVLCVCVRLPLLLHMTTAHETLVSLKYQYDNSVPPSASSSGSVHYSSFVMLLSAPQTKLNFYFCFYFVVLVVILFLLIGFISIRLLFSVDSYSRFSAFGGLFCFEPCWFDKF